ncbi:DUF6320 domain-containing protein [[Clostridium] hylemonae]|uniref:Alcohol acetyltransferase n=1 Tax=[Clostridium] hylemonae DSM 15053 TaxID=553973 RepID=C0BXQ0_9FIRM|nr:DUF6320 domain-containing protein [[Clostridium] hylemonae]EEG75357.1 alcohol acetyltransferase [[Clostridium] hylemonae DSM 15053]QEK17070.1 hypothetical protein LAJLEIBI_01079 [[Clostridium] hylemonae DSM 15053]
MFQQKRAYWRNLDNAAKLFSATSSARDTRVFRFYCVLKENIDRDILQEALNRTIKKYPVFLSVMRKGLFWHYLERSELRPEVREEYKEPCSCLYVRDKKALLFEVTYFEKRINFEVFHALTDGTGATEFLKELVGNYLSLAHGGERPAAADFKEAGPTVQDQENDSFLKYYSPDAKRKKKKKIRAYQIKMMKKEYGELQVTEGTVSVRELLAVSREKGVSMTVLMTAALMCAIHEEMTKIQEKKTVVLMVPVNLRKFFPSESMLNFFGWIEPGHRFGEGRDSFDEILNEVKKYFSDYLTKEHIAGHMNELIAFEKHKVLKWAPLEIKNRCIRAGAKLAEKEVTAVFSNMSAVKMPAEYEPYIERFGVFTSTPKVELCVCSYNDTLTFGFTSRYDSSNIQRNFFRILSELGADTEVEAPVYPQEVKPNYEGKKFFKYFSFCCIAAIVVGVMLNAIISPERRWAVFVAAGAFSMWLALAIGFFKRNNLLKNAMWQLLVVSIGCIIWDAFTGWHKWSVNFVLPAVCVIIELSMLIISKLQSHTAREYMIYYVMASAYSIFVPFILLLTKVITVTTPAVLCAGLSFLFLLALIIFKAREFKEEMQKKFHV